MIEYHQELSQLLNLEYLKDHFKINDEFALKILKDINLPIINRPNSITFYNNTEYDKKFLEKFNKPVTHKLIIRYPIYEPHLDTYLGKLENVVSKILSYCP